MSDAPIDPLHALPRRDGHFLLESGLHAETWLDLDRLWLDPRALTPQVDALAALLAPYRPTAVCGPIVGGALVAQAVALAMGLRLYVTRPDPRSSTATLFGAAYALPDSLIDAAAAERFAIVDDVISAGSSTRATVDALTRTGATICAVGALVVLGRRAIDHFEEARIPLVAGAFGSSATWQPSDCPLCSAGAPLIDCAAR